MVRLAKGFTVEHHIPQHNLPKNTLLPFTFQITPFTALLHPKHHRSLLNQMNGKPSRSMPQAKSLREK